MQLQSGTVVERYTIEGTLGSGGMAVVYLARHNQLGSLHAVKVLQVLTPSIRERLLQEGRVQGAMRHPNIVAVTDMVEVDGTPALVLEYVRGPSLSQLLGSRRPSLAQADELARGILRGTAFAHKHGLIHRDLKPGNVLLAIRDGELAPKITDFGLAKIVEGPVGRHETRTGVGLGTPSYMAPEQIRDAAHVDQRADVFSLGAILFELVTGRLCFDGSDKMETFQKICDGRYPNPRGLVPELPERMARAIEEALQVEASERPQSAAELLALWTGHAEGLTSDPLVSHPGDAWTEEILRSAEDLAPTDETLSHPPLPSGEPTYAVSLEFTPAPAPKASYGPPSLDQGTPLTPADPLQLEVSLAPEDPRHQVLGAGLAAAAIGAPFLLGTLILVFGSMSAALAAPGVPAFFGLALAGVAAAGAFSVQPPKSLVAWLAAPGILGVVGNLITGSQAQSALAAVRAATVEERAAVAAAGVAQALSADLAAMAMVTFLLLAIADAAAIHAVRAKGSLGDLMAPRRLATALVASLGSGGLWLFASHFDDGPGPFVIFATLFMCGLACAAIAFPSVDDSDSMSRSRVLVGIGTTVGVITAAKVLYLQQVAWQFGQVQSAEGDRLLIAEQFAEAVGANRLGIVAMWGSVALIVGLIPLTGVGRPRPLAWRREIAIGLLILAPLIASKWAADRAVGAGGAEVVPAFLDLETDRILGMRLTDAEDHTLRINAFDGVARGVSPGGGFRGVTVLEPGKSGLAEGDVILSLEDQPIAGVRPMLRMLRSCACGDQEGCSLTGCLSPGDRVQVTVIHGERMEQARVPVLFGEELVDEVVETRLYPFPGLSFVAPTEWNPAADVIDFLDGSILQVLANGDGVDLALAEYRGVSTGVPTLDGWAETQLAVLGADPADVHSAPAGSRNILGITSAAKAVTLRRDTGQEYWEFHQVSDGDRQLFVRVAMPVGRKEDHLPHWDKLLETLSRRD